MNRSELQQLARLRLREARTLLLADQSHGAYYLTGYAVECALKACIAKQVRRYDFPDKKVVADSHTHNLDQLLRISGLERLHSAEVSSNPQFAVNWALAKDWSEQDRYDLGITPIEAREMYAAVSARKHGVMRWLRNNW